MAKANGTDVPCSSLIAEFSEEAGLQGPVSLSFWGVLKKSAFNYAELFQPDNVMNTIMMSVAALLVAISYNAVLFYDNDVLLGIDGGCSFKYKEIIILASSEVVGVAIITPLLDRPHIPFFGGRSGVTQSCLFLAVIPCSLWVHHYGSVPVGLVRPCRNLSCVLRLVHPYARDVQHITQSDGNSVRDPDDVSGDGTCLLGDLLQLGKFRHDVDYCGCYLGNLFFFFLLPRDCADRAQLIWHTCPRFRTCAKLCTGG